MELNQPCPNPDCLDGNFKCIKPQTGEGRLGTSTYACACGWEWIVYTYVCVTKGG